MKRIITVAILLIAPLFLTGCGLKKQPKTSTTVTPSPVTTAKTIDPSEVTTTGTSYLTVAPSSLDQSINDHKALADQKGKGWRNDAQLYRYSVKFDSNFTIGQITENFTYGSPADAYNWWTVTISGKNSKVVRALIPKEDFLGTNVPAIPQRFWKINYVEALQLAESNGGATFRKSHSDTQVSATLMIDQPKNYLWWIVEYQSSSLDPYRILINPATKEVFDADGNQLTKTVASPSPEMCDVAGGPAQPCPDRLKSSPSPKATSSPKASPSPVPSADDSVYEE